MSVAETERLLPPPRVLVLVLGFDRDPWAAIENEGQRATWVSCPHPMVTVRFYYGTLNGKGQSIRFINAFLARVRMHGLRSRFLRAIGVWGSSRRTLERDDGIIVPVPDVFVTIGAKTFVALRHVLTTQGFDFVFRTNTSSYVNLELLAERVRTLPRTGLYAGVVNDHRPGDPYVSGAGILMSRDVVEAVGADSLFEFDLPDDVAIGRSAARAGVEATSLERVDINGLDQVDGLSDLVLASAFHYRCKVRWQRMKDIEVMRRLHARIKELKAL